MLWFRLVDQAARTVAFLAGIESRIAGHGGITKDPTPMTRSNSSSAASERQLSLDRFELSLNPIYGMILA
jgi:hypothetical protein